MLAALVLAASPALGDDWGHYASARFGYGVDVPPGFVAQGESANSDGETFRTPTATLSVYGATVGKGDFEAAVKQSEATDKGEGWSITYQAVTPRNASYSGRKGGRVLYVRMIALCGGRQFAAGAIEYGVADLKAFDPVVNRLAKSLQVAGTGTDCSH
jgi:hypothetical protein